MVLGAGYVTIGLVFKYFLKFFCILVLWTLEKIICPKSETLPEKEIMIHG
jgi:hypothetical protein